MFKNNASFHETQMHWLLNFFIWGLRPVKIISLILSRINRNGAKTGKPPEREVFEKDHPQAELGLSHMCPELGSNTQQ